MRSWYVGMGKRDGKRYGVITLTETPWWVGVRNWVLDLVCNCYYVPSIPFPDWFKKARDEEDPNTLYSLKEWYGDLQQFWHGLVCCRVLGVLHGRTHTDEFSFELDYELMKKELYVIEKEVFDMMEEE